MRGATKGVMWMIESAWSEIDGQIWGHAVNSFVEEENSSAEEGGAVRSSYTYKFLAVPHMSGISILGKGNRIGPRHENETGLCCTVQRVNIPKRC